MYLSLRNVLITTLLICSHASNITCYELIRENTKCNNEDIVGWDFANEEECIQQVIQNYENIRIFGIFFVSISDLDAMDDEANIQMTDDIVYKCSYCNYNDISMTGLQNQHGWNTYELCENDINRDIALTSFNIGDLCKYIIAICSIGLCVVIYVALSIDRGHSKIKMPNTLGSVLILLIVDIATHYIFMCHISKSVRRRLTEQYSEDTVFYICVLVIIINSSVSCMGLRKIRSTTELINAKIIQDNKITYGTVVLSSCLTYLPFVTLLPWKLNKYECNYDIETCDGLVASHITSKYIQHYSNSLVVHDTNPFTEREQFCIGAFVEIKVDNKWMSGRICSINKKGVYDVECSNNKLHSCVTLSRVRESNKFKVGDEVIYKDKHSRTKSKAKIIECHEPKIPIHFEFGMPNKKFCVMVLSSSLSSSTFMIITKIFAIKTDTTYTITLVSGLLNLIVMILSSFGLGFISMSTEQKENKEHVERDYTISVSTTFTPIRPLVVDMKECSGIDGDGRNAQSSFEESTDDGESISDSDSNLDENPTNDVSYHDINTQLEINLTDDDDSLV